jgi:hypothetical protein
MLNRKVIILSGFARGGTNIVWNILQSHPKIVAPPHETGELFAKSKMLRLLKRTPSDGIFPLGARLIDYTLFRYKMESLRHSDNRYIYAGVLYSREQMKRSALCLKSVNNDILLTHLLAKVYPDLYFIALTRNGYSLADGYIRRGQTARDAARLYRQMSEEMQRYASIIPRFKMLHFEDVIQRPFEVARDLFAFVDVQPCDLEMLRLKAKRIINDRGEHSVAFGGEDRKYWFSKGNIDQIIDPSIDQTQMTRLTDEMLDEFNHEAGSALEFFGYETYAASE